MGYAKYHEDIVLSRDENEYKINSEKIRGKIASLKIDEANSLASGKAKSV